MPEPIRRAKIVCTVGPASHDVSVLRRLVRAGMDAARLNASHGDPASRSAALRDVRRIARAEGRNVAVLLDLQGPKVRVGQLGDDPLRLRGGDIVVLGAAARGNVIPVNHRGLAGDVRKGDVLAVDEGRLRLQVLHAAGHRVRCRVVIGGSLESRKGINVPGRRLSLPALTAKDRRDVIWAVENGVDWIALSFVRDAADVRLLRRFLARRGAAIPIMAKLETAQAVDDFEEILAASDGIMVARGDLGVETPVEELPVLQKRWLQAARIVGKPAMIATQMLETMVERPEPTRAEVSDVANAVFDDADAMLLTAETAIGKYPVEAARAVHRIVVAAERARAKEDQVAWGGIAPVIGGTSLSISDAVGMTAARAARELGARAIVVYTESGGTARVVAKHRPVTPIFAFTPLPAVSRRLALVWGVDVCVVPRVRDTEALVRLSLRKLRQERRVRAGDLVVVTGGTPLHHPGSTNFMKILRVGR